MNPVEIRIGSRWIDALPSQPSSIRPLPIIDTIDVVVDGDNVTAVAGEDRPLDLLTNLIDALNSLLLNQTRKVLIPFYEAPWELALCLVSPQLISLSFYSLDPLGPVVSLNRLLRIDDLVFAVLSSARASVETLFDAQPGFLDSTLVRRLQRPISQPLLLPAHRAPSPPAPPVRGELHVKEGCLLTYKLDLDQVSAASLDAGTPFDLHALLIPGELCMNLDGHVISLSPGIPVHTIRALLSGLYAALSSMSRRCPPGPRADAFLRHLCFAEWDLQISREASLPFEHKIPDAGVSVTLPLKAWLAAIVAISRRFAQHLLEVNPGLNTNERLRSLESDGEMLLALFETLASLRSSPHTSLVGVNGIVEQSPAAAEKVAPSFEFPVPNIRRISLAETWTVSASLMGLDDIVIVDEELALLEVDGNLSLLSLNDASFLWRAPQQQSGRPFCFVKGRLFFSPMADILERIDFHTGRPLWRANLPAGSGYLSVAISPESAPLTVVYTTLGWLVGLDNDTGAMLWSLRLPHERPCALEAWHQYILVRTHEGFVYCLDPSDGQSHWRIRTSLAPPTIWSVQGDTLLLAAEVGIRSTMVLALDIPRGEVRWSQTLDGVPNSICGSHRDAPILYLSTSEQTLICSLDLSTGELNWQQSVSSAGLSPPATLALPDDDVVIIKTDLDVVTAFDSRPDGHGELLWSTSLCDDDDVVSLLRNLPICHRVGAIVVPGNLICLLHPRTGEVLHRLTGLPRFPESLCVTHDLRFVVGEQDDDEAQLVCFAIEHFLAIVP